MKIKITVKASGATLAFDDNDNECFALQREENGSEFGLIITAKRDITLIGAETAIPFKFGKKDLIMANGYQSWTETKEFARGENRRNLDVLPKKTLRDYAFKSYGSQYFHKERKGVITAVDYAYVKGEREFFIGNLNFKNAYLIADFIRKENKIAVFSDVFGRKLKSGETFCVFRFTVSDSAKFGEGDYFNGFTPRSSRKLFGYTSWYNHYQNINSGVITAAFKNADDRFDLFQIDDGFETFVGDWLSVDKNKFPDGLAPIVKVIHDAGKLAGIWLAPFAAEENSEIFKIHPDWFAKNENGEFIKAGCNWSGFYSLDLNIPQAVEYVKRVFAEYKGLGFDFFKLDFLYCCNLKPLCGKTRAETAEYAYSLIQSELSDKLILGCGAVLSSAFGKFDYMRIGPDVSLKFDDVWYMRFMHPERISTKVTLQNTIYRSAMNGRTFMNDPDVFLLRDDNISLSKKRRYALTKINALFGSLLMTSDNPKTYDREKSEILSEALNLFKNGSVQNFCRKGRIIEVFFTVGGRTEKFGYDVKKGVIVYG